MAHDTKNKTVSYQNFESNQICGLERMHMCNRYVWQINPETCRHALIVHVRCEILHGPAIHHLVHHEGRSDSMEHRFERYVLSCHMPSDGVCDRCLHGGTWKSGSTMLSVCRGNPNLMYRARSVTCAAGGINIPLLGRTNRYTKKRKVLAKNPYYAPIWFQTDEQLGMIIYLRNNALIHATSKNCLCMIRWLGDVSAFLPSVGSRVKKTGAMYSQPLLYWW